MAVLYVASLEGAEGKTALCLGLGNKWREKGRKVGFFKPIGLTQPGSRSEGDAIFAQKSLSLAEPLDVLAPLTASSGDLDKAVTDPVLTRAFQTVSRGKELLLVEGLSGQAKTSARLAQALGARVLVVAHYRPGVAQRIASLAQPFGPRFLGAILNAVPQGKTVTILASEVPALEKAGMRVFGVVPQDRRLAAPTVGEVAHHLQGNILPTGNGLGGLVENFMVGAIFLDPGTLYFQRRAHKAVITRLDRPDVQLAALETPTSCLILTGAQGEPSGQVYHKALDVKVPIILVKQDTPATIAAIEELVTRTRFHQEAKLPLLAELLGRHIDLKALEQGLAA